MTDTTKTDAKPTGPDYSASLYLPQTEFPMRAGLPKKEPELLARWNEIDLYKKLREAGRGNPSPARSWNPCPASAGCG